MKRYTSIILLALVSVLQITAIDKTNVFPDIENWKYGEIKSWNGNNLYVPINGAADLFLAYNFEEMLQTDYMKDSNYISVEVYRHRTPEDAYGVYSQEKPQSDIYFDIGVQGYKEDDYICFVAGNNYIKIRTHEANEQSIIAMNDIAEKQAKALNGGARVPALFSFFPEENKIPFSEMYLNENIMGFSFLRHSYEVSYTGQDGKYTLFILKSDSEEDATSMLKAYLEYLKLPIDKLSDDFYAINDKYTGQIFLVKSDRYLICTRGKISEEMSRHILTELAEKLE
jgi:hypothetical protein